MIFTALKHLGSGSYTVTVPEAVASFVFNDSDTRVIQSPQIRSVSGAKAMLKIGDRVPYATGSVANTSSGGFGAGGFNGFVGTQFQYQDVGVNIELTPTVHANHEITLKLVMEISSVTNSVKLDGFAQPVIGQRRIENEIRLREGEINFMGGIFEDREIKSWSGLPGLGKIPLFRYLFASEGTEHAANEIVFVLIPHLVRIQDVTPFNTRALDVGPQSTVQVHETRGPAAPSPAQKPSPVPIPAQPVQPPRP
jgi:general secretion pathway protein D